VSAAGADAHTLPAAHPRPGSAAAHGPANSDLERLVSLLDRAFLEAIGWDTGAQAFTPPSDHPQLGAPVCLVAGCEILSHGGGGLCPACSIRYRSSGLELVTFITIERVQRQVRSYALLCVVAGCGRPRISAPTQLCSPHESQQRKLGLPLASFLTHPQVCPMPSFGACRVAACTGPAFTRVGLCRPHNERWRHHRLNDPDLDFDRWCQTQRPPKNDSGRVVLLGLPPRVQTELLYGLQERCRHGTKTLLTTIRSLCERLRQDQVPSILELSVPPRPRNTSISQPQRQARYDLAAAVQIAVRRALSSPALERRKDIWDMAVYGHRGTLDFTKITQPWLRQAAKDWSSEDAPKRRGPGATNTIRDYIRALEMLSASLRSQRDDHGMNPTLLGRKDIEAFLNRLAYLETTEGKHTISAYQRYAWIHKAGKLLGDCRALGLARPEGPLAGLPSDFAFRPGDAPKGPDRYQQSRALPPVVLEQLVAALPELEKGYGREVRVAVQLLIDTGRRPDEVCKLPWDCLEQDPDGKHALVYTDFKKNRVGVRLAIADATTRLITEQQQAVRARFPRTPRGELVLLPGAYRNSRGTRALNDATVADYHRQWVNALPPLRSGARTEIGTQIEFDKAKVVPYAYRHTFAQRHADNGTPVDVLCELMDHDSMTTTQTYYRVTAKRTRAAVDKLATFQFDGRGNRIWREARALLEHEHQRRAVGQVAVPFGICTEPSNVKAGGHACPFRFRCHGCGHFRSDPSYLPELRGYLDMLLRNRERVRAATELDEWARAEAMPSDEEISRVRALIRLVETDLEQLGEEERRQIDEACRVVRATRQTVHLGMPTIRPPDLDPNLQPNLERNLEDLA
jgi:integrase